jgi:3',5'-cyclic-AMP phosphodiesterase
MTRRTLLTMCMGLMLVPFLWGCGPTRPAPQPAAPVSRWALFSDTHIPDSKASTQGASSLGAFGPHENLQLVVTEVLAAKVDAVAVTGDLARLQGKPGDYQQFRKLLQPLTDKLPVCLGLGNHDDRTQFQTVFKDLPGDHPLAPKQWITVYEHGSVRMIVRDSLQYVNKVSGLLGQAQRNWLATYLDQSDARPTLLCLHHPPGEGDGDLLDTDRLMRIIEPHAQVKAIVYGHSHAYRFSKHEGIHLINLPATGYSFGENAPVAWVEACLDAKQGHFRLHVIKGNTEQDDQTTTLTWR